MAADGHPLDFCAQPSFMTDPRDHAVLFAELPVELTALCIDGDAMIQGLSLAKHL